MLSQQKVVFQDNVWQIYAGSVEPSACSPRGLDLMTRADLIVSSDCISLQYYLHIHFLPPPHFKTRVQSIKLADVMN